jgi:hypothetical protein
MYGNNLLTNRWTPALLKILAPLNHGLTERSIRKLIKSPLGLRRLKRNILVFINPMVRFFWLWFWD